MGNKDISEKNLEQYADVFSDIVNALLYCGRKAVKTESLHPAPTETFYRTNSGWCQQFQDACMYEYQNGKVYIQYTIENQAEEEAQMVLRKAGYEGAVYRGQYGQQEHFGVVTIVLNWGKRAWHGSVNLHEFLSGKVYPDKVKGYIDNQVLHVFDMQHLVPEVRKRFKSDMRIVVDYLAEQENYQPTTQKIKHPEALMFMLKSLTGDDRFSKILEQLEDGEKGKEGITMCELLDRYWNDGVSKGMERGLSQGLLQGLSQAVLKVLLCRGTIPEKLEGRISSENDIDTLNNWITLAATTDTIEEFEARM